MSASAAARVAFSQRAAIPFRNMRISELPFLSEPGGMRAMMRPAAFRAVRISSGG
jgi:hypothetical protein